MARHLYGTKFKWKDKELERTGGRTHGLGGHLGLGKSEKERRGFFGWIDEKNGSYPESVAEGIHANMPDWMRDRYDTMEVLDAVLSVVGGNPRPRDMVVDYAKRLREQSRDMDEYYADEAAGARGFSDAGEMDAYDNMREREATGFHDVAAAGREADGARADLLADARARLADPNASEYDKQAARAVLRFRQRDGRDGVTAQGTEEDGVRFRFTGSREDFDKMRDEAVKRKGLVMPGLADKQVRLVRVAPHDFTGPRPINQAEEWAKANIVGTHQLTDSEGKQYDYVISKNAIGKFLSASATKKSDGLNAHLSVLKQLPEVIGESIEAEVHPDYLRGKDGKHHEELGTNNDRLVHRFYGAVELDGKTYRVKTTINEHKDEQPNKPHSYEVTEIELVDEKSANQSLEPMAKQKASLIGATKLLQGVEKSYDSGKLLLDESAKTTESGGVSQGFGSAATSLNQVASAMRKIDWKPGTVNVDIGGGRFDKATEYLREQGVESMVFDPFNRDAEHNRQVAERVRDEKVDTVTCNNVLNVIDSVSSRANVILQAAKALKPGGTAYFSVYEGDKSGVGRQTKSDSWQNNRVTKDYVSEIERYFDDVTVKDKVIIAKSPKATAEQSVWDFDWTYSGNDVRFRHRAPNGEESLLDERQYDEVRTGNFKRWFGDWENDPENASKVVDKNGEPLVVYHQTNSKQYINRETGQNWDDLDWREREEWDRRSDEEWNDAWEEQDFYTFDNRHARQSVEYPGFFFSPRYDEHHEYGDRTIAAYLDMKNPAIDPDIPNAGVTDTAGRDAMESLMRQGYDGVIRTEDGVPYEYIVFRPEQIKSATENNGDFSRENGDIRFRFVGERGAANQDAADGGERMRNKEIAEAMERGGKDARAIKLATGWERGKDGKWRHEEMDFDEVSMAGNLRWLADNPDAKRYLELLRKSTHSIFGGGAALSPDERKELDQLRGEVKGIDFSKPLRNADRLTLEDFVRDDRLFSAYPELRDVRVELVDDKDSEERGHYSESDATIVDLLNPDAGSKTNRSITLNTHHLRNRDEFERTLAHEVQHAVQAMEGFARGGNVEEFELARENNKRLFRDVTQMFDKLGYQSWIKAMGEDDLDAVDRWNR